MTIPEKYPSKLLEDAVQAIGSLPGVGKRSALRLALHLLRQPQENVHHFADSIVRLRDEAKYCRVCRMISDEDICSICSDHSRDHKTICVVENVRDVMSIENTGQYHGVYHVLHGLISPIDGVTPDKLRIKELLYRVNNSEVSEVIMATNPTVEGEATAMYLSKLLKPLGIKTTRLAFGLPIGGILEYADEVTLYKALENRNEI